MKYIIKKILSYILPNFLYKFIKYNYYFLTFIFNPLIIKSYFNSIYYKKKINYIDLNLVLIGQIQRSGGTLLSQLFDDHPQLYNYPSELILRSPKWDWSKDLNFSTIQSNQSLKKCFLKKNYSKLSKKTPVEQTKNIFIFNPFIEQKIYKNLKKTDLRSKFNAYFTSFFNGFINYKNEKTKKKKYVTAFLPRFFISDKNIEIFFNIYPNGKLISIIRDPETWLMSAKKHSPETYIDTKSSLEKWKKCCEGAFSAKEKYNDKVIIIKFENLLNSPKNTLKQICSKIDIVFEENILTPTFNGESIDSDSSFKTTTNIIDKSPLLKNNKINLSNEDHKILSHYVDWYKNLIYNNKL